MKTEKNLNDNGPTRKIIYFCGNYLFLASVLVLIDPKNTG